MEKTQDEISQQHEKENCYQGDLMKEKLEILF